MKTIVYCSDCRKDVLENSEECNCEELEGHDHEKCKEIFHTCSICGTQNITPNTGEQPHYIKAEKNRLLKATLLANARGCITFTTEFSGQVMSQTDFRQIHSCDIEKIFCDCTSMLHGNSEEYVEMFKHPFYCKHLFAYIILHNKLFKNKIEIPLHDSNKKYLH